VPHAARRTPHAASRSAEAPEAATPHPGPQRRRHTLGSVPDSAPARAVPLAEAHTSALRRFNSSAPPLAPHTMLAMQDGDYGRHHQLHNDLQYVTTASPASPASPAAASAGAGPSKDPAVHQRTYQGR
jgi:hypothetical protein